MIDFIRLKNLESWLQSPPYNFSIHGWVEDSASYAHRVHTLSTNILDNSFSLSVARESAGLKFYRVVFAINTLNWHIKIDIA